MLSGAPADGKVPFSSALPISYHDTVRSHARGTLCGTASKCWHLRLKLVVAFHVCWSGHSGASPLVPNARLSPVAEDAETLGRHYGQAALGGNGAVEPKRGEV